MANITQMNLYICKDCNLLLLRIEKRFFAYESATLKEDGWYTGTGITDTNFDVYKCPECGEDSSEHGKLDYITLPIETAQSLIKLWKELDAKPVDSKSYSKYEYGIPLDEPELPSVIVEKLL